MGKKNEKRKEEEITEISHFPLVTWIMLSQTDRYMNKTRKKQKIESILKRREELYFVIKMKGGLWTSSIMIIFSEQNGALSMHENLKEIV